MAPGVHGGTAQLRRGSLTAADEAASPLVVASVLSEVGSAELQKMCLKQFEGLYSQVRYSAQRTESSVFRFTRAIPLDT